MHSTAIVIRPQVDPAFPQWRKATWEDYLIERDKATLCERERDTSEQVRLFFDRGYLWIDMGSEGVNHARFNNLFTMLFFAWFARQSEQTFDVLGGVLLEKHQKQAASPDLVLYLGGRFPQWREGEPRRINLDEWRVPDLVGEVGDTTLATDLDEKKQLYARLNIPEYWVVDIQAKRVLAFRLQEDGKYRQCSISVAIAGLPIWLLERTLEQLESGNGAAALWFARQIAEMEAE